jgi:murein DD-endopeptidase MepM/ murein hydrolase activator NlpD
MALACTWGGSAQSNINFSKFFQRDHTIAIRFLMQYPIGYAGAFLSVHGQGRYFVGQGDFKTLGISPPKGIDGVVIPGRTSLLIEIGNEFFNHPIGDHSWHHVALTRTGNQMQVFIDGEPLKPFLISTESLPDGTLRFGHSGFRLNSGIGGQFYGLLDDFALFNSALSHENIKRLANAKRLTGKEGMQFGCVFLDSAPESLRLPLQLSPGASYQEVSDSRNAMVDLPRIPLPLNSHMHLPFAPGEAWHVTQGYNQTMSHNGYAAFCWDLVRDGAIGGSEGEMIYSASEGPVWKINQDFIGHDGRFVNSVSVWQGHRESCDYLHIKTKSALVSVGDKVSFGTRLAHVGDIGAAEGAYHLHMAVSNGQSEDDKSFTMPAAFSNYEAEVDGEWKLMIRGIPQTDQRIRRPLDEGPIRYTAAWERRTDAEIQMYGVSYEKYRAKYDSIWNDGWRLAMLEAVAVNDHARYTAVWRLRGGGEFQLYGATRAQLDAENGTQEGKGWRLDHLTSYVVDGQARYTGVWRPSNETRPLLLGESRSQFEAKDNRQREHGFCLHRLSTHTHDGETRYSALWRLSNSQQTPPFIDLTKASFEREYHSRFDAGFRVQLLSITVVNGEPKYSGTWVKRENPGDEERWHGLSYGDLRARYDVLWQTGWRLKLLEPYVP